MGRPLKGGGNEDRKVRIDETSLRAMHAQGMTIVEIAHRVGCSTYPIGVASRALGLSRRAAPRQGIHAGPSNPSWRGGRRVRPDGYIEVWTPAGPRLEHQVVMEAMLGRPLAIGEIVHHEDRDRSNNQPENLTLMTQSQHMAEHKAEMASARWKK
ncbi:HNH endonuclease signature motif containing protein [Pseudomonas fluorescens]|uniref:HNH endonuclease signature motif containing protein n=1 Tax=Pseudomonas fluorescens TaxID=294 RepID=UPI00177DBE5D|nr:HNH endonuclease [Pseudomonas fluorescens]